MTYKTSLQKRTFVVEAEQYLEYTLNTLVGAKKTKTIAHVP